MAFTAFCKVALSGAVISVVCAAKLDWALAPGTLLAEASTSREQLGQQKCTPLRVTVLGVGVADVAVVLPDGTVGASAAMRNGDDKKVIATKSKVFGAG